jgi:hypothetical protein
VEKEMFYFLIFHTSISANKELDKKLLTTFLYGCILYIILHAILNSSDRPFIQMIKQYFWFILGLDVVCMAYIYKTIYDKQQEAGIGSQSLLGKLTEFMENLVDTSVYKDQIDIPVTTITTNPVPITTTPQTINNTQPPATQNDNKPASILKPTQPPQRKSVDFDETRDEIHEFETTLPPDNDTLLNMITNPGGNSNPSITTGLATDPNDLATPINRIRQQAQLPSTPITNPPHLGQHVDQPSTLAASQMANPSIQMATPLTQIRQQVQQQQQPPNTIPPPMSGKLAPPVATKVKPGDGAVRDIKYDPSEFLRDIQYETRLPSEQSIPPSGGQSNLDSFGNNQGGLSYDPSQDDDKYSSVSKVSDLGSMLDFDMKEFENTI